MAYENLHAKSERVAKLEAEVYALNNKAQYEDALRKTLDFLNSKTISDEDAYYANIILSGTYKRIFDYDNVLLYLGKAEDFANKIKTNRQYYLDNVVCEKAFALFDIQKYDEAKSLMQELANSSYKHIDAKSQPMLIMQEAYLLYQDKKYGDAEKQYDIAIDKMKAINSCDLPIIYGKKIALYGEMHDETKMLQAYKNALHYADSCKIKKYHLYAVEIIRNTYEGMRNYNMAFKYFATYDSLNTTYNADGFKDKLKELEVKYETEKKEQDISLKEQTIVSNRRLIALLIIAIGALVLMIALYMAIQHRRKLIKEKKQSELFTKQLLNHIEIERKRIATDLHDSVNNELLLIKSSLIQKNAPEIEVKMDRLMNIVRDISRNLHPILFEELGLKDSIENLVERIQKNNHFLLNAELNYSGQLKTENELQLYRIIQEAINNILKYAKAEAAIITIDECKDNLVVEIKDNGKGFNVSESLKNKNSFGLHNIIERAKVINGLATISSTAAGTIIHIEIPIKK